MNSIASFRMCTLPTIDLIAKIDAQTDVMFKTQKVPSKHIPAQPNEDYDLLVGELVLRVCNSFIKNNDKLTQIMTLA